MISGMLSQEEIDALMSGPQEASSETAPQEESGLNEMEIDAIGEIGNISMGTAATTLFTLLGHKVQITTPRVTQTTIAEIAEKYPLPFIAVQVDYTVGVRGTNLLILKEEDVKIITSLMLGGDGRTDVPEELNEIHLSAISESMNQMIGSSSTSLSEMIGTKIDISPPVVSRVNFNENQLDPSLLSKEEAIVCISFRMTVGDLIDSNIMQILPMDFVKKLVDKMMNGASYEEEPQPMAASLQKTPEPERREESIKTLQPEPEEIHIPQLDLEEEYEEEYYEEAPRREKEQTVNVKQASFASFDGGKRKVRQLPENIDLIKDVMLKVTVELGRTTKQIDEVLQFTPGSILELDRPVGEPLDVMVNGKKVATGEVVVIDENYGIRITDIIKVDKRLKTI
ncbi:MAG: flagellar motor switch phosphatase FliY [Peptostreptococcaceae bacterium]|nr:flagellar motor switch phosphatase FliY [Peptostreptococcaceae bacterium]